MRKRKKLLFILAGVLVLVGASAAYAVTTFTDIGGTTHEKSIVWAVDNGITVGYADGTFRPNNPTTRGQMTTFLNRFYNNLVKPLEGSGGTSGDVSGCVGCHDDTTLITGKKAAWAHSAHGAGELYWEEGDSRGCAGCHSGGTFSNRIAAGAAPNAVTDAMITEKTPIDCRACHQIHKTGKPADWALETVAAVTLFATPTRTYDGGSGNLCANCHQARRVIPAPASSTETTVTARYGPHPSPQASEIVGTAGAAANGTVLQGAGMMHYTGVENTCVGCHMVDANHTFAPDAAACVPCHGTIPENETDFTDVNFDVGGFQTEVINRLNAIGAQLVTLGLLENADDDPGTLLVEREQASVANPGVLKPTAQAVALWNYLYVVEDSSKGVHNPGYTTALLNAADDILAD